MGPKNLQGVPNLLVEVLSDETRFRDEVRKKAIYESNGVDEYWIVDPDAERVHVFRLRDRNLDLAGPLSGTDALTSPVLPGFQIAAADVFHAHEG